MKSIGEIYPEFSALLEYRKKHTKSLLETMSKDGSRDWYSPPTDEEEGKTVLESKDIADRFKTDRIEAAANNLFSQNDAFRPDFMALQKQFGVVNTAERVFRHRHATVPRILAHSLLSKLHIAAGREDELIRKNVESIIAAGKQQLDRRQA